MKKCEGKCGGRRATKKTAPSFPTVYSDRLAILGWRMGECGAPRKGCTRLEAAAIRDAACTFSLHPVASHKERRV